MVEKICPCQQSFHVQKDIHLKKSIHVRKSVHVKKYVYIMTRHFSHWVHSHMIYDIGNGALFFSSNKIRPKNGSSANAVCQIAYFSLFCYRRQIELTVYRTTCLGLSLSRVGISLPSRLVITRQSNIIFPFYKISWTWKKYQKHLSCTSNYVGYSALRKSAEPFALVEIYN
jgi:hypothetical protein